MAEMIGNVINYEGVCFCGKACTRDELHVVDGKFIPNIKICTSCFIEYNNESTVSTAIDIIPISAKEILEAHPDTFEWSPPPVLKTGDHIKICCEDEDDFGERFWCIAVTDTRLDGSIIVKINNVLLGNYKQKIGDIISYPIFPEHIFDYEQK